MATHRSKLTYLQLARALSNRISGVSGEKILPSYRALAKEYGVSLSVCQNAIGQLVRSGQLRVSRGHRAYAAELGSTNNDYSFFGVIHPYNPAGDFTMRLNFHVESAFMRQDAMSFPLIRATVHNNEREIALAEEMQHNHVRGLLLSPNTNSPNGAYFTELSHRMPVVLFDQGLSDCELPLVKFDYADFGRQIVRRMKEVHRRRILLLRPHSGNASEQELRNTIKARIDSDELVLPLYELASDIAAQNCARIKMLAQRICDGIAASNCDTVYCAASGVLNNLILPFLPEELRKRLIFATQLANLDTPNTFFLESNVWVWRVSYAEMIGCAVRRLLRWTINHHAPRGEKRILLHQAR